MPAINAGRIRSSKRWNPDISYCATKQDDRGGNSKMERTVGYNGWTDDIVFIEPDIVYSRRGGQNLKLHLVLPMCIHYARKENRKLDRRFPLVVYAKGSGFTHPEYKEAVGRAVRIAEHGFIVAMVEYSNFLEGNTFLDTCRDYKTAIRFLRAHADEYCIDAGRVAAWGTSSGATDAQFAAFTGNDPQYKTDEFTDYDDSVSVLVAINGPTDMNELAFSDPDHPIAKVYKAYWDDHPQQKAPEELCREASTIFLVGDRPIPPVMLVHGTEDPLVSYSQTGNLYRKLSEYGHEVVFFSVEGAGHGSAFTSEILEEGVSFIKEHMPGGVK